MLGSGKTWPDHCCYHFCGDPADDDTGYCCCCVDGYIPCAHIIRRVGAEIKKGRDHDNIMPFGWCFGVPGDDVGELFAGSSSIHRSTHVVWGDPSAISAINATRPIPLVHSSRPPSQQAAVVDIILYPLTADAPPPVVVARRYPASLVPPTASARRSFRLSSSCHEVTVQRNFAAAYASRHLIFLADLSRQAPWLDPSSSVQPSLCWLV